MIRFSIATFAFIFAAGFSGGEAVADPYRWCAEYGGGAAGGGGRNCYFVTLEQCRWAISGNGGTCTPNPFFNGRPVVTPEDGPPVKRRSRS